MTKTELILTNPQVIECAIYETSKLHMTYDTHQTMQILLQIKFSNTPTQTQPNGQCTKSNTCYTKTR